MIDVVKIVAGILISVGLLGGGYYLWSEKQTKDANIALQIERGRHIEYEKICPPFVEQLDAAYSSNGQAICACLENYPQEEESKIIQAWARLHIGEADSDTYDLLKTHVDAAIAWCR